MADVEFGSEAFFAENYPGLMELGELWAKANSCEEQQRTPIEGVYRSKQKKGFYFKFKEIFCEAPTPGSPGLEAKKDE